MTYRPSKYQREFFTDFVFPAHEYQEQTLTFCVILSDVGFLQHFYLFSKIPTRLGLGKLVDNFKTSFNGYNSKTKYRSPHISKVSFLYVTSKHSNTLFVTSHHVKSCSLYLVPYICSLNIRVQLVILMKHVVTRVVNILTQV